MWSRFKNVKNKNKILLFPVQMKHSMSVLQGADAPTARTSQLINWLPERKYVANNFDEELIISVIFWSLNGGSGLLDVRICLPLWYKMKSFKGFKMYLLFGQKVHFKGVLAFLKFFWHYRWNNFLNHYSK